MTARVITGSKQEIARTVEQMEGDVREVIVFVEEPAGGPTGSGASVPVPATVEEMFAEMEPYTVQVGNVDDSREAIYTRMPGE